MKERTTNGKAIIVGAGIGGLVTGAILAEKEGWNLLVLEKERVIGGKCYSFEHFDGDEETFRHILFHNSRSKLVCSEPSLSELISHKVFGRYIFEGGWHSFIGADRSRMSFIAAGLGTELKVHPSRGFRVFAEGQWQDLRYLMREWTPGEVEEGKHLSREMNLMSLQESSAFDQVDIQSYLRSRSKSDRVRSFHEWLAAWESGLNDPAMISAGEHIKVISMVHCAGRDFQYGGGGQPAGGFNAMTRTFAEIIEKKGGTIRTGIPVEEILVEDYHAVGVRTPDGVLRAPRIICDVPMQRALSLLPDDCWPAVFKEQVAATQPLAGVLGWISLKRPLHPDFQGIFIVPVLPGCSASDGFRGDVLFSFEDVATYDPTRAPKGEGLMPVWAGLLPREPDEIHNEKLLRKVTDGIFAFFETNYSDFRENLNWYIITACEELYSVSMTPGMVGDRRLPVTHPLVQDLYFTGDSIAQWSFGISGTVGGAVNCASAASGKDYSTLLPFYMR